MKKTTFPISNAPKNFIRCGVLGLFLEVLWTGFLSFRRREPKLTCKTSLWMFGIYGMAGLLSPLHRLLQGKNALTRGLVYTGVIFTGEYLTGSLLRKKGRCPWDYSDKKYNVNGLIRLDYAPLWFFLGLLFEHRDSAP